MGTDHVELKQLTVRREQVERRLQALRAELSTLDGRIRVEQRELGSIDSQVAKLKQHGKAIVITEHAILRYLERVKGIDIEAIKREILPEAVKKVIGELGPGEYPAGTHSVKVKDSTVVTILTKEEKEPKPKRECRPVVEVPEGQVLCPMCKVPTDRLYKKDTVCAFCFQDELLDGGSP